jgi:RimJ/RimL family protein N-acetyltransferase
MLRPHLHDVRQLIPVGSVCPVSPLAPPAPVRYRSRRPRLRRGATNAEASRPLKQQPGHGIELEGHQRIAGDQDPVAGSEERHVGAVGRPGRLRNGGCHWQGSWPGRRYQRQGAGTEMRAAVLFLAFDGLGALAAESGALEGNDASSRVSGKLG